MEKFHFIQIVALLFYAIHIVVLFFYSGWKRKTISLGSFETTVLPLVTIVYLVFNLRFPFSSNLVLLIAGFVLYAGGAIIGMRSFNVLGWVNSDDFWLARFEDKKRYVVTTGMYKYIRHPIFTSMAVSYLGLVMIFFHPVSVTIWVVVFILGVITSLNEEKFMTAKFPEYKEYMKRTGRFFPSRTSDVFDRRVFVNSALYRRIRKREKS